MTTMAEMERRIGSLEKRVKTLEDAAGMGRAPLDEWWEKVRKEAEKNAPTAPLYPWHDAPPPWWKRDDVWC